LNRNLKCLWTSQLLSQIADGIAKLALLWFVYSVTGSAFKTTLIGLFQTVSSIVCTPFVGVLVDRLPKKMILIVTDLLRGLFIGLVPWLLPEEMMTVEMLYVLVFLYGVFSSVFTPALSASIPFLISAKHFTAGNAVLQSTTSIGIILGPIMSGIGIAALGPKEVLSLNTATYLASVVFLLPLRFQSDQGAVVHGRQSFSAALMDAVRFTFTSSPAIIGVLVIAALYTFASAALTTLMPVFGKTLFHLGPVEVGYLWSSLGVGFLLASFGLLRVTAWSVRARLSLNAAANIVAGLALVALLGVMSLAPAVMLMTVVGVGLGSLTPIAWGIMQEISPPSMVGRVMALYTAVAMATSLAGIWFFGWITQSFGEPNAVFGIGVVLLLVGAASVLFRDRIADAKQPAFGVRTARHAPASTTEAVWANPSHPE
jgi:MFS family permease